MIVTIPPAVAGGKSTYRALIDRNGNITKNGISLKLNEFYLNFKDKRGKKLVVCKNYIIRIYNLFTKREHSFIFSSLKKTRFLRSALFSNF